MIAILLSQRQQSDNCYQSRWRKHVCTERITKKKKKNKNQRQKQQLKNGFKWNEVNVKPRRRILQSGMFARQTHWKRQSKFGFNSKFMLHVDDVGLCSQIFYLVKWQGYAKSLSTWEPIENLQHCSKLIQKLERQIKLGWNEARRRSTKSSQNVYMNYTELSTNTNRIFIVYNNVNYYFAIESISPPLASLPVPFE